MCPARICALRIIQITNTLNDHEMCQKALSHSRDGMLMMLMKCSAGGILSEGAQGMARALLHKRCMIQCITSRELEVRTICPDFICVLRARLITREL